MCVKGQADNKTIPGCAAGAKTPHLDCAVKTDALPGAASENQRFDISRALKEHCSLESAGLIKKKKNRMQSREFQKHADLFFKPCGLELSMFSKLSSENFICILLLY